MAPALFYALAILAIVLFAFAVGAASSTLLVENKKSSSSSVHNNPMLRDIILLTCTVSVHPVDTLAQTDPGARLQVYRNSIRRWLAETNFEVVVVDNSGVLLTMDKLQIPPMLQAKYASRFNAVAFDEATHAPAAHLRQERSKGRHELFAIAYAMEHAPLLQMARAPQFVLKVTGRFYIPPLETTLATVLNRDTHVAVRQSNADKCQLVGARIDWAPTVFATHPPAAAHVEDEYKLRLSRIEPQERVCVLPLLAIPPTVEGGMGTTATSI